ncbi:MAG TPA: hypothetical protein VJ814_05735 [Gaiellaceae bacterium]|nr:hypothetical protein [Gaiellaceae bacterium]
MTPARRRQRGIALLLVVWVFMLLGVLALDFAQYIRDDAMASVNFADETRGYFVAIAGMNLALYEMSQAKANRPNSVGQRNANAVAQGAALGIEDEPQRLIPADGEWHEGDFAGQRWRVRVSDDAGRIPLNSLKPNSGEDQLFLHYVIENLVRGGNRTTGVDRRMQKTVDTVVDSIFDWRDRDDRRGADKSVRPNGAESEYYRKQRIPYDAKNGQFESLEELLRVRGVTPALFYGVEGSPGLRDVFSVRPAREDEGREGRLINIGNASPAVLLALVGDADAVTNLIEERENGTFIVKIVSGLINTNSGGTVVPENYLGEFEEPQVATVEARADVASDRNQARIAALVDMRGGETLILRWYDRAPWDAKLPGTASDEGDA